jgi:hypothetical protein
MTYQVDEYQTHGWEQGNGRIEEREFREQTLHMRTGNYAEGGKREPEVTPLVGPAVDMAVESLGRSLSTLESGRAKLKSCATAPLSGLENPGKRSEKQYLTKFVVILVHLDCMSKGNMKVSELLPPHAHMKKTCCFEIRSQCYQLICS